MIDFLIAVFVWLGGGVFVLSVYMFIFSRDEISKNDDDEYSQ